MKLLATDECSEKFATRIPYLSLLARIQSAAAMTSLVFADPLVVHHVEETSFAVGAAPVFGRPWRLLRSGDECAVAAPVSEELPGSEVRLTLAHAAGESGRTRRCRSQRPQFAAGAEGHPVTR